MGSGVVYAVFPSSHLQFALYSVLWIGLVKVFQKLIKVISVFCAGTEVNPV